MITNAQSGYRQKISRLFIWRTSMKIVFLFLPILSLAKSGPAWPNFNMVVHARREGKIGLLGNTSLNYLTASGALRLFR